MSLMLGRGTFLSRSMMFSGWGRKDRDVCQKTSAEAENRDERERLPERAAKAAFVQASKGNGTS